ncbi:MAG: 2-oxo acid dehydrogenase subunit E2, partial [Gammaproteobacteria bacterium]
MYEFKLPDIGEGLVEGELIEWSVENGDEVEEGDLVAVVSTDKVNVELYAPCTGKIHERFGEPGDVIDVGTVFI